MSESMPDRSQDDGTLPRVGPQRPQSEPLGPWRLLTYNFFGFDRPHWYSQDEQRWVRLVRPPHFRANRFAHLPTNMLPTELIVGPAVTIGDAEASDDTHAEGRA